MLKKRIIPSILLRGGRVVTSQSFKPWRTVGSLSQYLKLQVGRESDELLIANVDHSCSGSFYTDRDLRLIRSTCNIPVTMLGGVDSFDKAEYLIAHGADRVGVCSALFNNPRSLLPGLIQRLGRQSVVVDVPVKSINGEYHVWDWRLQKPVSLLQDYLDDFGVDMPGEVMLSAVDNDGHMDGFNIDLIKCFSLNCPLVLRGGAGIEEHFYTAFAHKEVSALAASSVFAFSEITPRTLHHALASQGIPVRHVGPLKLDNMLKIKTCVEGAAGLE